MHNYTYFPVWFFLGDLWEEILAEEDGNLDRGSDFGNSLKPKEPEITVLYRRRKCQNPSKDVVAERSIFLVFVNIISFFFQNIEFLK